MIDADLWLVHLGGQWLLVYLGVRVDSIVVRIGVKCDSVVSPYLIKHKVNLDLEF
jgi:hypothetical protein